MSIKLRPLRLGVAGVGSGLRWTGRQPRPALAQRTLANGMKIIVKEDHRSPVAVSMVWYRAGSMDEVSGTTGVAHVLEHMMFKGTQKVPRR